MINLNLNINLNNQIIFAAYEFAQFRDDCKKYLLQHKKSYDKFTIVQHDSFIGFITEAAVRYYISNHYRKDNIKVISWEENFDIEKIKRIISTGSSDPADIAVVEEYFYDRYDLKIIYNNKSILVDVKTALTQKEPSVAWNFMYPVVQANKAGKDYMILTYYIVSDTKNIESLKKIVIVGYTSEEKIKDCNIIYKGQKTRFGTISQTDNYETNLAIHYKEIDELIDNLKML